MVAFTLPLNGTVSRQIGDHRITAAPGDYQILLPSVRATAVRAANLRPFRALTYFAPKNLLRRRLGMEDASPLSGLSRTLQRPDEIVAGSELASFIRHICQRMAKASEIRKPDRARALSEAHLSELLSALFLNRDAAVAVHPASGRTVLEVEERMWEDYAEPLTIADLAREAGVGVRSLQLAFMACRGNSPKTVLSELRMARARARLITAGPRDSVTNIALACGIAHLGRFSVAYRKRYGEMPSRTLANVRSC
jgi:AraC-like DNA-binding protein